MAEDKPKINVFSSNQPNLNLAEIFKTWSSSPNQFPMKKEEDKEKTSQFNQSIGQNSKSDTIKNIFLNSLKPSDGFLLVDSNPKSLFDTTQQQNTNSNLQTKKQPQSNLFSCKTNNAKNIFALGNHSQNKFQTKTSETDLFKLLEKQSHQPTQSNSCQNSKLQSDSASPFTLSQKSSLPRNDSKSLFVVANQTKIGGLFDSSTATEGKKDCLFSQQTQVNKGGICTTLTSTKDKKEFDGSKEGFFSNIKTFEPSNIIQTSSQGQAKPQSQATTNLKTQEKSNQSEKNAATCLVIEQEKSEQESIGQGPKMVGKISDQREAKRIQLLDYLKKMKQDEQKITLLPQSTTNEYNKRQIQIIEKNIESQKNQNQESKRKINELEQQKKEKEKIINELRSKSKELNFKSVIKPLQQINLEKVYPDEVQIQLQIKQLTEVINDYYNPKVGLQNSEIHQDFTSQNKLRELAHQIDNQQIKQKSANRQQKEFLQQNAQKLRKIEFLRSFGKYAEFQLRDKEKSDVDVYVQQKTKDLEKQLEMLKTQNEKKRIEYENKRTQLRNNLPSMNFASGRSSNIMKSTIFD